MPETRRTGLRDKLNNCESATRPTSFQAKSQSGRMIHFCDEEEESFASAHSQRVGGKSIRGLGVSISGRKKENATNKVHFGR